jgi:uncharacterized DUF497 family protein
MNCTWDENKQQTNLAQHGLDFSIIGRFDWPSAILRPTYSSQFGTRRFKAIGFLDDDLVVGIFSPLGSEAVALISLRPASRKERREYVRS